MNKSETRTRIPVVKGLGFGVEDALGAIEITQGMADFIAYGSSKGLEFKLSPVVDTSGVHPVLKAVSVLGTPSIPDFKEKESVKITHPPAESRAKAVTPNPTMITETDNWDEGGGGR